MVESTSNSSNVHGLIDDNNNSYKSMVMNVMRMNQVYAGECSIVDEKPNIDATRFFDIFLKIPTNHYIRWMHKS